MTEKLSDLVPLTEAAAAFHISRANAYALAKRGEFPIPVLRIGGVWRVSRVALERQLADLQGEAS